MENTIKGNVSENKKIISDKDTLPVYNINNGNKSQSGISKIFKVKFEKPKIPKWDEISPHDPNYKEKHKQTCDEIK